MDWDARRVPGNSGAGPARAFQRRNARRGVPGIVPAWERGRGGLQSGSAAVGADADMRLILVRHGAVQVARPRSFYGGSEVPLSEDGRAEAQNAAAALAGIRLDHLACSPLSRARYGAERIAAGRQPAAPEVVEDLREIHRGRWTGRTAEEVEREWPLDLAAHAADPARWRGHQGESLGDLRDRVLAARDRLAQRHPAGVVAVVAHLYPIRALVAEALGRPFADWEALKAPTGSLSVLTATRAGWVVELFGWKPSAGEPLPALRLGP